MLPNDEEEHRRLDNLHFVSRTYGDLNVRAPLSVPPTNILDVGAGSGTWCIEVAKEYPTAHVQGIDISPIDRPDIPENCKFFIANLDDGLKFDNDSMDLVNSRLSFLATLLNVRAMLSLKKNQWVEYMREAYRVLKPGIGWIQCCEFNPVYKCDDDSVPPTAATWKVKQSMRSNI